MSEFETISELSAVNMHDGWFDISDKNHFWMQWRYLSLRKELKSINIRNKFFLEIGCGHGIFIQQMEKDGYLVDGCDLNVNALKIAKKTKGRLLLYNIYDRKPSLLNKYDGVFLMDVIEHVENDIHFLDIAKEYTKNEGYIIINVPAIPFLFSKYDKEVGHLRRYTKKHLYSLFKKCNITPLSISYWGIFLIPIAFLRKIFLIFYYKDVYKVGFKPPNKIVHYILKILLKIELSLPFNWFCGTSIIAIGKKQDKNYQGT